jgi:hypothetical protein
MADEIILHDWNPSPETLQRWAYDEKLFLEEQDEDLALGRRDFLPILIPLADDPNCPKADYILSSLDFYLMFVALRGDESALDAIHEAIEIANQTTRPELAQWIKLLKRRLLYREGIGIVNREIALQMGRDLLNGLSREAEITISAELPTSFEVQLSVPPFHIHQEWLTICKATGQYSFRR